MAFLLLLGPGSRGEEQSIKMSRRNSDSNLYCKARDSERSKETSIQPEKPLMNQAKYLDQEKLEFVQSYLEKADDARSVTTETSDSGMLGTHGTPSELGMEETSGKIDGSLLLLLSFFILRIAYPRSCDFCVHATHHQHFLHTLTIRYLVGFCE